MSPPSILFVRCADHRLGNVSPPLGLLYLAGAVRRDCRPDWDMGILDLGLFGGEWRQALEQRLDRDRPLVVALSAMANERDLARRITAVVRECCAGWGNAPLVLLGGPFASFAPAEALEDGRLDGILVGEGERALPPLLDRVAAGVPAEPLPGFQELSQGIGGWHAPGSAPADTPVTAFQRAEPEQDLDALAPPAWDLLHPLAAYAEQPNWNGMLRGKPYMSVLTSRGCPYGCTYCHHNFGRKVRLRSAAAVVQEITTLHREHGIREIHIIDDIFNIDRGRALAVFEDLAVADLGLHIAFPNGIRGDLADREQLAAFRRGGTYKISYGVETASPRLQKEIGKHLDLEKLEQAVAETRRLGMIPAGFFMFGFPGETKEEMLQTVEFAVRSRLVTAKFFRVIPFPGTVMGREWAETTEREFTGGRAGNYHFLSGGTGCATLPPAEVNDILASAYLRFFSRPGRLVTLLRRHPGFLTPLGNLLKMFGSLLRYRLRRLFSGTGDGAPVPMEVP
jgi:anaerobic magnesium-protoporphyrin IX monomethyl ester cyclase